MSLFSNRKAQQIAEKNPQTGGGYDNINHCLELFTVQFMKNPAPHQESKGHPNHSGGTIGRIPM